MDIAVISHKSWYYTIKLKFQYKRSLSTTLLFTLEQLKLDTEETTKLKLFGGRIEREVHELYNMCS